MFERIIIHNVPFKIKTLITVHEPRHVEKYETKGNVELLLPYPVVVDDEILEIATAVISADLSLD
jgi:hypothetical protein